MPEYITARSILSKLKDGPDPYFGITYSMNLYRGCQHQCIYCDSRSYVYGIGDLARIRIKSNAVSLLDRELGSKRKKAVIGTGSMNDPYMPVESTERQTRRALEVICRHHFPVHILTKSDLVTRDTDILMEIRKVYAAISFTITVTDDEVSRRIEPGAPLTSNRFKALEKLAKSGFYCGVLFTPVLPFISDTAENIRNIVQRARDAGASYVLACMGMTQREGQREYFYEKLDQNFPGLRKKYADRYGLSYNCPVPKADALYRVYHSTCEESGMPVQMRFYREDIPVQRRLFD